MIALVISLILIVGIGLLGKYTTFMTPSQNKFILVSSILYIILFGVLMKMLTSDKGVMETFMNNRTFAPLIFYILWYVSSACVVNVFTGRTDYRGFFEDTNPYMSKRHVRPR